MKERTKRNRHHSRHDVSEYPEPHGLRQPAWTREMEFAWVLHRKATIRGNRRPKPLVRIRMMPCNLRDDYE